MFAINSENTHIITGNNDIRYFHYMFNAGYDNGYITVVTSKLSTNKRAKYSRNDLLLINLWKMF